MKDTQKARKNEVICLKSVRLDPDFTVRAGGIGKLIKVKGQIATVAFEVPNLPRRCEGCGMISGLSRNAGTGEIVCMSTGCGHEHGFKNIAVEIPFSNLKRKKG